MESFKRDKHVSKIASTNGSNLINCPFRYSLYFKNCAQEAAKKAQKECQAAATAYQRAFGVHAAAKVLQQTLEFATTDFEMQQRLIDFEL